jgi:non-specific serine/threonine protein kinase
MARKPIPAELANRNSFGREVRDALAHLYDPAYLQTHPLAGLVPVDPTVRAGGLGRALRQLLVEAIDATRPIVAMDSSPSGSLINQILTTRYVEALEPALVQDRLAISRSEYYREHQKGVDAIISLLWQQWQTETESTSPPPGLPVEAPSAEPTQDQPVRHNLPLQLTSFVGREREIADLTDALADTRLLTLTGTGGCGKTRLALQMAGNLVSSYADGVWLVELAPLADPSLIGQTVASLLDVHGPPNRPIDAVLADALRSRRLLLILDNCEHLLDTCAHLADALLRGCPKVQVLATSREALGIAGEVCWRVPSLAVPSEGNAMLDVLGPSECVRLFVERARAALPGFTLTSQNAPTVGQICRRLDGIPLAIELAATRVKGLSVEQIANRLDRRFRLLTGGSRAALPRQQTLAATVDWSYDLLNESERTLFNRLAVFVGGFTLEAAEEVCSVRPGAGDWGLGDPERPSGTPFPSTQSPATSPQIDVLDLLFRLVEKSLVVAEPSDEGTNRYHLLETLRQYALEKLTASDEAESIRARHAAHYRASADQAGREFWSPRLAFWYQQMKYDLNNVRAALRWTIDAGDVEQALLVCGPLGLILYVLGEPGESSRWLAELLALPAAAAPTVGRGRALVGAAELAIRAQLDLDRAEALLDEALLIVRERGDQKLLGEALKLKAMCEVRRGNRAVARALAEEAEGLGRLLGDAILVLSSVDVLGEACFYLGDYSAAQACWEKTIALWDSLGSTHHSPTLDWLGHVATATGDYRAARAHLVESMRQRLSIDRKIGVAYTLNAFAGLAAAQGQLERAVRLSGAASRLCELSGMPSNSVQEGTMHDRLPSIRAALGDTAYDAAWPEGRAMTLGQAVALALSEDTDA